jgi:LuxR family transcriptional regulator, maltose regulon positive regulatory protein
MAATLQSSPTREAEHGAATVIGLDAAVLDAKLRPPPKRAGLVPRRRLIAQLMGARDVPLALLAAPAGYGKTTLLSQWADRDKRPFAWVAPDAGDNDPTRLLTSVVHALDAIEPIGYDVFRGLTAPPAMAPSVVIARLGRCLARSRRPCVLVVDDAHVLDDPAALDALIALADHLPAGFQLALASRGEPGAPLARLRAYRNVVELRTAAFAMTPSEAAAMLGEAGLHLDAAQVATLVTRTEGWPAGLYLGALSLCERPVAATAVDRFDGDDRLVADYLRQEMLSALGADELAFLMRTSVLDRLCGSLCDAVLERHGSADTLRDLSRSNVLLVPLDSTDDWYRYHSLLAGMLRTELRRLEPGLEPALHQRASAWHVDHDDPHRAIEHAIAAHDTRRAGELLLVNVPRFGPRGHVPVIRGWGEFSDQQVADEPALALVAAATQLTTGDGARLGRWTAAAASGLTHAAAQDASAEVETGVAMLRAGTGADGLGAMREAAARAHPVQREDGPWRSICRLFEGVAGQLMGDRHGARTALQDGARSGIVAAPAIEALCVAQLAFLALDEVDWSAAEALTERAAAQVERCGMADYPTEALVFALSALVRARRGRIEEATRSLRRSRRLAAMLVDFIPWYEAEVRLALARAALSLGDVAGSRTLLDEAVPFVRRVPDGIVLAAWLADARADVDNAAEALGAGWSLTTAELRVLRLLPSHLSFPEIAKRLYVSANTVKTHARAIYRKLQAGSRAEAVTRARDAGLIDGAAAS